MDVNRFGITIKCIEIDQKLTKKKEASWFKTIFCGAVKNGILSKKVNQ